VRSDSDSKPAAETKASPAKADKKPASKGSPD
jgi:hypothetical protein